jgi:hypothetical protein
MGVLHMLVRQAANANRQHLIEREINQYLRDEVGDKKASLERLNAAIEETSQDSNWRMMEA